MPVRAAVRSASYHDSVVLMRLAEALGALRGVREAAALMGTPANHDLLAAAGLATPETEGAGPGDLVLAVSAADAAAADAALGAVDGILARLRSGLAAAGAPTGARPRTLEVAVQRRPDATLALVSVPGAHAAAEARRALRAGLHVFLFSDNVPLAEEVRLKRLAVRRRRLCMGPDCGTAYLGGVGLGFANVVRPGRVGIVAASGTGLQAVAAHLDALGEGISHGIGVGGRDLSAEVGGVMTRFGLEALAADPATALVVLVSKPPAPAVLPAVEAALTGLGKPAVVCCLGAPPRATGPVRWVATLEDAAAAAVATLAGRPWAPRPFEDAADVRARLARHAAEGRRGPGLLGLYTGGTLAHEARLVTEPLLGPVPSNLPPGGGVPATPPPWTPPGGGSVPGRSSHRILDLGADELTLGRPHPMLDPEARAERVRQAGRDPAVGVLLLDLVLGRAAHPDPVAPLAAAIRAARAAARAGDRALGVVASVVGTDADPQDRRRQAAALAASGAEVLPSNAQAARFAALVLRPEGGAVSIDP